MGTKDIVLVLGCFVNGNRNGNNICVIPRGLRPWRDCHSCLAGSHWHHRHCLLCMHLHIIVVSTPPGTSRPLVTSSCYSLIPLSFSLKRKQSVFTIKARKKTSLPVTIKVIQTHSSLFCKLNTAEEVWLWYMKHSISC